MNKVAEYKEFIEKVAKEMVLYHASPVQDIKKFRKSEDTSGNNKGEVIFASKEPGFAAAFGAKWNDGNAALVVEQKDDDSITTDNFEQAVLKVTDDVDLDKPASMYKIKGDFKNLRHKDDIECVTDEKVKVVEEEKFDSFKELAKKYGLRINKVSDKYIDKKLESKKSYHIEKEASEKIQELDDAFPDPTERAVAYMIATSHEYKKPNIAAALSFVKNYKWEKSECRINDMQGINKPINEEKVQDMAKNMKVVNPFIVVNQLHGIRPQTPGKKILIDGHHRHEACKCQGRESVPVYKGTYIGEDKNSHSPNIKGKVFAVDFDGTLVENKFPDIGAPKEKVINYVKKIKANGGTVILWTCRDGYHLAKALKFLKDNNIPYDNVNNNPKAEFGSRKIYADYYIDDRAISVADIDNDKVAEYKEYIFEKIASKDKSPIYKNKIQKAGNKHNLMELHYTDKKGKSTERIVEPYEIRGEDFFGFDTDKEEIRRFKINQINRAIITNTQFNPRWDIKVGDVEPIPKRKRTAKQFTLMDSVKAKGGHNDGQSSDI
jgi:hypothetical protein